MKEHVLFIVENNPCPKDKRVWYEAEAVYDFGYMVSVISPKENRYTKNYEKIDNINVYRHPMPIEANSKVGFILEYLNATFWESYLCLKIFIKHPFHIIHSANPPDHVFIIALFFKLFGVKYIFDHHDITPENYVAKFDKKGIMYKILLLMEKMTFKTADIVISTNESYKKIAINRGNMKENEVFVVRNGPDLNKIKIVPPNNKLKEGFDFSVGYVGIIGKQEGIENLLAAVKYLIYTKEITNIKFIVVGSGPHLKELIRQAKEMKIEKFVHFTGFIPDSDLYEILSTSDICINPEFGNEFTDKSTMIKIMEYMFFGKPIIQFYTTEGEVTAGNSSIYIKNNSIKEFADAIVNLCSDPEKRKKMGNYGKKRISEELCWDNQAINLKSAYEYLEKN